MLLYTIRLIIWSTCVLCFHFGSFDFISTLWGLVAAFWQWLPSYPTLCYFNTYKIWLQGPMHIRLYLIYIHCGLSFFYETIIVFFRLNECYYRNSVCSINYFNYVFIYIRHRLIVFVRVIFSSSASFHSSNKLVYHTSFTMIAEKQTFKKSLLLPWTIT